MPQFPHLYVMVTGARCYGMPTRSSVPARAGQLLGPEQVRRSGGLSARSPPAAHALLLRWPEAQQHQGLCAATGIHWVPCKSYPSPLVLGQDGNARARGLLLASRVSWAPGVQAALRSARPAGRGCPPPRPSPLPTGRKSGCLPPRPPPRPGAVSSNPHGAANVLCGLEPISWLLSVSPPVK